jgi:hypothetical protein
MKDTVFSAWDNYNGSGKLFMKEEDAKTWVSKRVAEIHQKWCIEHNWDHDSCLCEKTAGEQECAGHHELRTMVEHELEDCSYWEEVGYEKKKVHC